MSKRLLSLLLTLALLLCAASGLADQTGSLTAGKTLRLFGLSIENRAYICFAACAVLLLNSALVWRLYKKTERAEPPQDAPSKSAPAADPV